MKNHVIYNKATFKRVKGDKNYLKKLFECVASLFMPKKERAKLFKNFNFNYKCSMLTNIN